MTNSWGDLSPVCIFIKSLKISFFRDGQITPGTELLVIDGQSVAASGLSSADVNELLRSRFGFIATCSSNSFGVRLPASSEQPNTADFSSTDFQKRVLDKNGDQEGTDRLLDLVVEKRRVDHHRLDNINLTSGTTFALTSWSARVGGCGENNMVVSVDKNRASQVDFILFISPAYFLLLALRRFLVPRNVSSGSRVEPRSWTS